MPKLYQVEKITDKKIIDGQLKYKIKWKNLPDKDSTWEPIEHLTNVVDMINEYEANSKKQNKIPTQKDSINDYNQNKLNKKRYLILLKF